MRNCDSGRDSPNESTAYTSPNTTNKDDMMNRHTNTTNTNNNDSRSSIVIGAEEPDAGRMDSSNKHNNTNNGSDDSIRVDDDLFHGSINLTTATQNSFSRKNSGGDSASNSKSSNMVAAGSRSVSFATGTMFDNAEKEKGTLSPGRSRVASLKAKLRSSFSNSSNNSSYSKDSNNHDSFQRSWGGALMNLDDIEDMSSSTSNNEGEDDDSLGDMDASENFRTRAQQSMSFNMSFMKVGMDDADDDEDCMMDASKERLLDSRARARARQQTAAAARKKTTGRGSIFVIADEKFGQTKVVQTRLEKAAKKIQRFLRRCLLVLRQYNEEREYLQNEVKDTETRRLEELSDIVQWIQDEKEQIKVELEQEFNPIKMTPEEYEAYQKEADDMRKEIQELKEEAHVLKQQCKDLKRENGQLEMVNPEKEAERARLEKEVKKLETDKEDWTRIGGHYKSSVEEAERKVEIVTEKRKSKRAERKIAEKTIKKIIKLLEESGQAKENPKLLEKVKKLKFKRDKKLEKLKAQTVLEVTKISGGIAEEDEEDQEVDKTELELEAQESPLEKLRRKEEKRKARKAKQDQDANEPPEMVTMGSREPTKEPEAKKAVLAASSKAAGDSAATKEEKEKKKKEKDKKKKEKKQKEKEKEKEKERKRRQSQIEGDETLMKIYEATQQKKDVKQKDKQPVSKKEESESESSESSEEEQKQPAQGELPTGGALMSLIMG